MGSSPTSARRPWTEVFRRSAVGGPVFAVRRDAHAEFQRAATILHAQVVGACDGSEFQPLRRDLPLLDGGVVTRRRGVKIGPGLHGTWLVGVGTLRLVCDLLGLRPPRRLHDEASVPTPAELEARLDAQLSSPGALDGHRRLLAGIGSGPELAWAAWACAQPDPGRWAAYADTMLHLDLGEHGAYLLRPRSGAGMGPRLEVDVVVLTAHNPGRVLPDEENRARQRRLRDDLRGLGLPVHEAVGMAIEDSHFEPSCAVVGAPVEQVRELARSHGQDAFFVVRGSTVALVATDPAPTLARRFQGLPLRSPSPDPAGWGAPRGPDLSDPRTLPPALRRGSGMGVTLDRSVNRRTRVHHDQQALVDVPGTPPAWHEVVPGLWVGDGRFPPDDRFDLVVTLDADVAAAHPPTRGRHVVVPLRDTRWEPVDAPALATAVAHVVAAVHDGRRVLVRCTQGLNRAPLVVAEAMAALGTPRDELVDVLRRRRDPRALENSRFADHVRHGSARR